MRTVKGYIIYKSSRSLIFYPHLLIQDGKLLQSERRSHQWEPVYELGSSKSWGFWKNGLGRLVDMSRYTISVKCSVLSGSRCSQNIAPCCLKNNHYNPYIGGICWIMLNISRVLSQGYPTFPFD